MSQKFTAILEGGVERFAATMSTRRATLFYDLAVLLERYVELPCGIFPDTGKDEYQINSKQFIAFFECLWEKGWIGDSQGFIRGWTVHAAGMIENIEMRQRNWVDRNGISMKVQRYVRTDEIEC